MVISVVKLVFSTYIIGLLNLGLLTKSQIYLTSKPSHRGSISWDNDEEMFPLNLRGNIIST